ncbi:small-conductance calcium-activated potassium channel protein [Stylonychia lemnae]|uniref:Small-conductance calcium-activated potassium channel protein n=1 Tax=Stylonychia lemnae TaxID=5949 RepID=A0A078B5A4_STYLE|nr:small-conductance calcium-activated potassium channel protein [Stylonychia lemnae]|eukprot:CDW88462.1 small-conductance calcium-activated potassium channel protein [Stylonychia lemnae]
MERVENTMRSPKQGFVTNARDKFMTEGRSSSQIQDAKAQQIVNIFKMQSKKKDKTEDILRKHGYLPKDVDEEMENIQLTNDYFNKIKYLEFVIFFFAWVGVGSSIVEYELRYNSEFTHTMTEQKRVQLLIMLCINALCTICVVFAIVSRYLLTLQWQIEKKLLLPLDNLITTKYYKSMMIEIFCSILSPLPGLENMTYIEDYSDREVTVELRINVLLLCTAMIIRLYLIIRFALSFSRYRNSRMQRLCMINGTEATFMYSMKAFKQDRPYVFISGSLVVPLIVCGYGMRMFERPLIPVSGQDFDSLGNCIWCVIITMATVGYGDYFPISNFGRIVGILACLWGVFIVSIFVVTLNNLLEFSKQEEKSYDILCKLAFKEDLRMKAVNVILSAQRQKVERQKDDLDISRLAVVFRDFRKNVFSLKQVSKRVRAMYEDYNEVEVVTKDVEEINQEVNLLMSTQEDVLNEFRELSKQFGDVGEDNSIVSDEQEVDDNESNSLSELEKQMITVDN